MEAPKCKLCGERHYGMCAIPKSRESRKWQGGVRVLDVPADPADRHGVTVPATAKDGKIRFDRTAYQRDYMRKRRAKVKKP